MKRPTRGPWKTRTVRDASGRASRTVVTASGTLVAKVSALAVLGEVADANAVLIAAAPDMLEALEGLLDLLKETEPNGFPEGTWAGRQIEAAVAALAKARGES